MRGAAWYGAVASARTKHVPRQPHSSHASQDMLVPSRLHKRPCLGRKDVGECRASPPCYPTAAKPVACKGLDDVVAAGPMTEQQDAGIMHHRLCSLVPPPSHDVLPCRDKRTLGILCGGSMPDYPRGPLEEPHSIHMQLWIHSPEGDVMKTAYAHLSAASSNSSSNDEWQVPDSASQEPQETVTSTTDDQPLRGWAITTGIAAVTFAAVAALLHLVLHI